MSEILESPSSHPEHFQPVHPEEIALMVKNYKDTMPHDDTQSVWFSIYELMALIADNKANGIRIYYGRHHKNDAVYPGKHNVILVATRDAVNPGNPSWENSHDLLHYGKNAELAKPKSYTGMGLDQGPLCPPRCTPTPPGSSI